MRAGGLLPDCVLSSPALRARETAAAVMGELGLQENTIQFDQSLYLATRERLLGILAACRPQLKCVLLVGHNPGLEEFLEFLCASSLPRTDNGKLLTTAALARVRLQQTWESLAKGSGTLMSLTYPRDLADA